MITCAITKNSVIGLAIKISNDYKDSASSEDGAKYLRKAKTELFNLC